MIFSLTFAVSEKMYFWYFYCLTPFISLKPDGEVTGLGKREQMVNNILKEYYQPTEITSCGVMYKHTVFVMTRTGNGRPIQHAWRVSGEVSITQVSQPPVLMRYSVYQTSPIAVLEAYPSVIGIQAGLLSTKHQLQTSRWVFTDKYNTN